jgi:hypothetical protein
VTHYPDREEIKEEYLQRHDVRQILRIDAARMQNAEQNAAETAENTALAVIDGTSSRRELPQPPASAAAKQQNATATPPATDRRRKSITGRHTPSLIYGTGIDFSRKDHKTKEKTFSNIR